MRGRRDGGSWRVLPAILLAMGGLWMATSPANGASAELLVGAYFPGASELGTDLVAGVRFAFPLSPKFEVEAEISFAGSNSGDITDDTGQTFKVDYDTVNIDLTALWNLRSGEKAAPLIFVGIGYANVTANVSSTVPGSDVDLSGLRDDTGTAHFGLAYRQELSELIYFRLDARARWFSARDTDEIDYQATVGVGFTF